jgi:hypothetical protein
VTRAFLETLHGRPALAEQLARAVGLTQVDQTAQAFLLAWHDRPGWAEQGKRAEELARPGWAEQAGWLVGCWSACSFQAWEHSCWGRRLAEEVLGPGKDGKWKNLTKTYQKSCWGGEDVDQGRREEEENGSRPLLMDRRGAVGCDEEKLLLMA